MKELTLNELMAVSAGAKKPRGKKKIKGTDGIKYVCFMPVKSVLSAYPGLPDNIVYP